MQGSRTAAAIAHALVTSADGAELAARRHEIKRLALAYIELAADAANPDAGALYVTLAATRSYLDHQRYGLIELERARRELHGHLRHARPAASGLWVATRRATRQLITATVEPRGELLDVIAVRAEAL